MFKNCTRFIYVDSYDLFKTKKIEIIPTYFVFYCIFIFNKINNNNNFRFQKN